MKQRVNNVVALDEKTRERLQRDRSRAAIGRFRGRGAVRIVRTPIRVGTDNTRPTKPAA